MSTAERGYALAGGLIGGAGFVAGLWLFRSRLLPLLRQSNHAVQVRDRYDPVTEVVRSLENLKAAIERRKAKATQ